MEGNRSTHRPQAARQVGGAGRWRRYRHGSAPSETARHVQFAALGTRCGPFDPSRGSLDRTGHGELARASLCGRPYRHHAQVARAVRVGDPPHRERSRSDPTLPARSRRRGQPQPRSTASSRPRRATAGRSGSGSARSTGCAAARSSHFGGMTSTPRLERCGSTRASWPRGPAQRGAMPRTSDPPSSISTAKCSLEHPASRSRHLSLTSPSRADPSELGRRSGRDDAGNYRARDMGRYVGDPPARSRCR